MRNHPRVLTPIGAVRVQLAKNARLTTAAQHPAVMPTETLREYVSMSFLEQVWEHREEVVYREIFGDTGREIYTLPATLFGRLLSGIRSAMVVHWCFRLPTFRCQTTLGLRLIRTVKPVGG
jgi:hypothetical protein